MLVAVLLWGGVIACDAKSVSVSDLSLGLQRGDDPGQTTDTRDTGQRAASPVRRECALASGRATTQQPPPSQQCPLAWRLQPLFRRSVRWLGNRFVSFSGTYCTLGTPRQLSCLPE